MGKARELGDKFLSLEEAAEYLGVSYSWLRSFHRIQRIPSVDLSLPGAKNRRFRFRKSSLDRWLESRSIAQKNQEPKRLRKAG